MLRAPAPNIRAPVAIWLLAIVGLAGAMAGAGPRLADREPAYAPRAATAVCGMILRLDRETFWYQGRAGARLVLETPREAVAVHLGPAWYVAQVHPPLEAGETVTVVGSWTSLDGEPGLVAGAVVRAGGTWHLRDERGRPAWAGRTEGGPIKL